MKFCWEKNIVYEERKLKNRLSAFQSGRGMCHSVGVRHARNRVPARAARAHRHTQTNTHLTRSYERARTGADSWKEYIDVMSGPGQSNLKVSLFFLSYCLVVGVVLFNVIVAVLLEVVYVCASM